MNNFNTISGLKINLSKTQLVWIGSKKYSTEKLCHEMNFHWTTQFKLLGIQFDVDLANIPKLNYDKKLVKIKEIINQWNKRHTTPIGRITLIKSLIISQMNHLFISLPTPSNKFIKDLNEILFNFLWKSKVDKIKRKQITQEYSDGGLKMIEINNYIQSLKSSWIRRLINSPNSKWNILLNKSINTDIVLKTGPDFISCILTNLVRNSFWKDTFIAFKNIQDRMKLLTWHEFITQPIWYNKNITMGGKSIFFIDWFNKNIVYINDLLDENGSFLSLQDLQSKFDVKSNFLTYLGLQKSILTSLHYHGISKEDDNPRPFIPFHIKLFCSPRKGSKIMYNILNMENVTSFNKSKWGLFFMLSDLQWKTIYQLPFVNIKSTKLQWLQFRINHHILTTNKYLFKIGKECSKLCNFCKQHDETIFHVLWECPNVQELFQQFFEFCQSKRITIQRDPLIFIFGLHSDPISTDIYSIFLVMKSYIYRKRCLNEALTIHELLIDIKTHISTLRYIAIRNCRLDDFYKRWETWLFLLNRLH